MVSGISLLFALTLSLLCMDFPHFCRSGKLHFILSTYVQRKILRPTAVGQAVVESTSTRSGLIANGVHVAGRGGRRRNKGFGYIDRLMQPGTSRCGYKLTRTRCDNICVTADRQQRKEQPSERLASTIERQILCCIHCFVAYSPCGLRVSI